MAHTFFRKILLGITGGIAAYKAAEIVRLLRKSNREVKVVMTQSALAFVQPLTFSTLSNNPAYTQMFEQDKLFNCEHIELAQWTDVILIAPATANIMAKLAHGIADDLLSTICLACEKPLYVAPAMNKVMWEKQVTQANITTLQERGIIFLGPDIGEQACGDMGLGRMLEPKVIVEKLLNTTNQRLIDKNIIITAGPTFEPIDPVRFIGNRSSGKMGYAIAKAAIDHGAKVTLISGPTRLLPPEGLFDYVGVTTADEMQQTVMQHIKDCDIFISAAAIADYKVENYSFNKIKKTKDELTLKLKRNPDVLSEIAKLKQRPFVVGFAAETDNLETNALQKLKCKNIDIIAANLVGEDCGFDKDENRLLLLSKVGEKFDTGLKNKNLLAYELIKFMDDVLSNKNA